MQKVNCKKEEIEDNFMYSWLINKIVMDWKDARNIKNNEYSLPGNWLKIEYFEVINILFRFENSLRTFVYIVLNNEFKEKWKDNGFIMQGLEEIGSNPFPAVLNIKAKEPSQYAGIASFLEGKNSSQNGADIVDKINYNQNKLIIERLGRIIPAVEKSGAIIAILFVIVAIIMVFNTIRLIIFTAREEISVMKLVGASNFYIRGPFVVSGIMYGIFSAILTLLVLGGFAYYSDSMLVKFAGSQNISDLANFSNVFLSYFVQNFGQIFGIIMGAGIILGAISSYMAVRRYLRV